MASFRKIQSVLGLAVLLVGVLSISACNAVVDNASCNQITVSFDDGGNSANDGPTTFSAYAGSTLLGTADANVSSVRASVTIPLSPTQPAGTSISVRVAGTVIATASCTPTSFFNPGDGRLDPKPGDRIAAYCNPSAGTLVIYVVKDDSKGILAVTFTGKALLAAGSKGLSAPVPNGNNGVVTAAADGKGNIWLAWNGGQYHADGQPGHGFAKGISCIFNS